MSKKKKFIVICSMVVLLVATAYVNILLNSKQPTTNVGAEEGPSAAVSYFEKYRTTRETSRTQQFTYLDSVLVAEDVSVEAKASAEAMKLDLVSVMETELILEGLIKAQGFPDAVITMNEDSVNVVVETAQLTSPEVAQIVSIILNETEYAIDDVVIIPYN